MLAVWFRNRVTHKHMYHFIGNLAGKHRSAGYSPLSLLNFLLKLYASVQDTQKFSLIVALT